MNPLISHILGGGDRIAQWVCYYVDGLIGVSLFFIIIIKIPFLCNYVIYYSRLMHCESAPSITDNTEMSFGGLISTSNIVRGEKITVRSDSDLLWTISIKKHAVVDIAF